MSDIIQTDEPGGWQGYSLDEVCQQLLLDRHFIEECVEHDIALVTGGDEPVQWIFTISAVQRIQKAYRLHRDLDIHLGTLSLVLELLDERAALREEVASLRRRLGHWEMA